MLAFKLDAAKGLFFDRQAVTSRLTQAKRRVFNRAGGLVRKVARRSIRPISKRLLGQIAVKKAEANRLPAKNPRRRTLWREIRELQRRAHSRPGKPPKSITGLLRSNIFYAFDPQADSVVIGPTLLNKSTGAQHTLEYGGQAQIGPRKVSILPRPYMGPAQQQVQPAVAEMFRDSL